MGNKITASAVVAGSAFLASATPAAAQTLPNQPILGWVLQQQLGACYVKRGPVIFQRKFSAAIGPGTKAAVIFKEIFAGLDPAVLQAGYELSGDAVMTFSDATSGRIRFKQLLTSSPNYHNPAFRNYTETFNATTKEMTVRFNIVFPNCFLPVVMTLNPVL